MKKFLLAAPLAGALLFGLAGRVEAHTPATSAKVDCPPGEVWRVDPNPSYSNYTGAVTYSYSPTLASDGTWHVPKNVTGFSGTVTFHFADGWQENGHDPFRTIVVQRPDNCNPPPTMPSSTTTIVTLPPTTATLPPPVQSVVETTVVPTTAPTTSTTCVQHLEDGSVVPCGYGAPPAPATTVKLYLPPTGSSNTVLVGAAFSIIIAGAILLWVRRQASL